MENEKESGQQICEPNTTMDSMAVMLAEVIRCCMRAAAGRGSTSAAAAMHLSSFIRLTSAAKPVECHSLVTAVLKELSITERGNDVDQAILEAARMGVRVFVERTCRDGAARGRASIRESGFLDALKQIEPARQRVAAEIRRRRSAE